MSDLTRRGWLKTGALLAGAPCACLAATSQDCCTVPEAPSGSVRFQPGLITLDLTRTPALHRTGAAVKVADTGRRLQVIIARPSKERFVALDQKCTHGGGALTYVHRHRHLYCTCWGHSKFALDGSVLRWPNQQTPRPLRTYEVQRTADQLIIRVEGLA